MSKTYLNWSVGYMKNVNGTPEKRVPAVVPGAVQLDWAKAHGWDSYTYGDNYKQYLWMEDVYWSYKTKVNFPKLKENENIYFVSKGIDYKFIVKVNGEKIYSQEGMFTPFEIDLTGIKSGSEMEIIIYPAPKRKGAKKGRSQADQCCKPAVSYGWDWHPRLIPLGIWDDTYLKVRPSFHIKSFDIEYDLDDNLKNADICANISLSDKNKGKLEWELFNEENVRVIKANKDIEKCNMKLNESLQNPELWWPNGQGKQALYTSVLKLYDAKGKVLDKKSNIIGFRNIKLVMNEGGWQDEGDFPKTRNNPPITLEVNGRRIFGKGSNWVSPEIFPGCMTESVYKPLLKLAKDANMNLLRMWGGSPVNKDCFFELCDRMGLMVWQEFPLSCNNYKGTPSYLKVLDRESKSIIKRLKSHPCVVLWCGGNELFNSWSKMTDQSKALRLLNRNCYDLDPDTPFLPTSPVMGIGHGNYVFLDPNGKSVFDGMLNATCTAYTEFGMPGPSSFEYLKKFIPEDELNTPKPGTSWETHHAFNAWIGEDTWLCKGVIEHYFGKTENVKELIKYGQLLQCEGYKCIFEEARRQKPACSMALNWCYNEPWPSAANNSIINWPNVKKPAYYAVKSSLRPALASARISKFNWKANEVFDPEIWILSDKSDSIRPGTVKVFLEFEGQKIFVKEWKYPEILPNRNLKGPKINYKLPDKKEKVMKLILKVDNNPELNSQYVLKYGTK